MFAIIVGIVAIAAGLLWIVGSFYAAGMASRTVANWEIAQLAWPGLIPIAIGLGLIIWS